MNKIVEKFEDYAEKLLNNTILKVKTNDKTFRICEIEMYYCGKDHMDEYTHCNAMQLENGKFYAHKFGSGTYKVGTYKCMDIVYGNKKKNIYFGILIRSIEDIETGEFYCGPCVSVNKLLGFYEVKEFKDFFEDYDIDEEFTLEEVDDLKHEDIYIGPRVGLGDKYPEFKNKEYRYAIKINKIKKQKIFRLLRNDDSD